jgi:hypothetical protein
MKYGKHIIENIGYGNKVKKKNCKAPKFVDTRIVR